MFQCFKSILARGNIVVIFRAASSRTPLDTPKQRIRSSITSRVDRFHWKTTAAACRVYFARALPFHSSEWGEMGPVLKRLQPKCMERGENS